jgi:hypothetical protein
MAAQTMTMRKLIKRIAIACSVLWIAATFYQQFLEADPGKFGFRASEVEARMKTCGGSFQQRYDCKEAIIIAKGHDSFLLWVEKAALVLAPPLLLAFLLTRTGEGRPHSSVHAYMVRRPTIPVSKRRVR